MLKGQIGCGYKAARLISEMKATMGRSQR